MRWCCRWGRRLARLPAVPGLRHRAGRPLLPGAPSHCCVRPLRPPCKNNQAVLHQHSGDVPGLPGAALCAAADPLRGADLQVSGSKSKAVIACLSSLASRRSRHAARVPAQARAHRTRPRRALPAPWPAPCSVLPPRKGMEAELAALTERGELPLPGQDFRLLFPRIPYFFSKQGPMRWGAPARGPRAGQQPAGRQQRVACAAGSAARQPTAQLPPMRPARRYAPHESPAAALPNRPAPRHPLWRHQCAPLGGLQLLQCSWLQRCQACPRLHPGPSSCSDMGPVTPFPSPPAVREERNPCMEVVCWQVRRGPARRRARRLLMLGRCLVAHACRLPPALPRRTSRCCPKSAWKRWQRARSGSAARRASLGSRCLIMSG